MEMKNQNLETLIDSVLAECGYNDNSYFKALSNKDFLKEDFIETQIQFFWAVVFFSRPMAALAAKIPTPDLRIEVVRNVWEEHGEGDPSKVHGTTFIELLSRLGNVTLEEVDRRALWPEIRSFNTVLSGTCVLDEYLTAAAVMGIIERMFADISAWIGRGIVSNGWLAENKLVHYTLHEELDIKHSQDFFDILEKSWNNSAEDRYAIEQGLKLGAYIFNNLYEGLYKSRTQRVFRQTKGMHSRAEG
jgi:pyrroloquinoline-quinone synthase